ncbi:phosphotransferase [Streptomyces sp. ME02-6987-2C]|uniref:phosphotransferase n=1 Tax=unclassified Streptomyces TaxID=2593676 RepID=UPI00087ACE24|nr:MULTISPECIES: phosphotransferase [unclassified Streptomyces]MDX3367414.1 phosphotransferase [Streptomyces sp. ME02-6987-2C]MDX3423770.1 phosphotransferase [Streptomyces sp. ME02-6985-2c]REH20669.1 phosphotransferase family enzyme [Streptomyces sp. 2221.1]SDT31844.1 Phosphotransferase enzyme family protein [Streptomyces sp. 2114.2]
MTEAAPAPGGYNESEMYQVLEQGCAAVGLNSRDAHLLRGHTNAVILLKREQVVVKIARRGSQIDDVARTVAFVHWLMDARFPTVPLYPVDQPVIVDGHAVTFWAYLPQPGRSVDAAQLAKPLYALHTLPSPKLEFPRHDNLRAIRRSLSAITCLPTDALQFLSTEADRLEEELEEIEFPLAEGLIQGDPQHRNALHTADGGAVLCDWDTVARGQPEWDLVTVEVHCRRFGFGQAHYQAFADAYGWDVTKWPGYETTASIRELRMITTNARKVHHAPASLTEVQKRVEGLRKQNSLLQWSIL